MKNRIFFTPLVLSLLPMLTVIFCFILPYAASFAPAISSIGTSVNQNSFAELWKNSGLSEVTLFTLKQAFLSVLVSLALGLPGAWLIGSGRSRFSPLLRSLTAIPFAMPSILVVLGFVLFFGNSGWLNRIIMALNGSGEIPLRILYKPGAIILAHSFFNFPLVIRLVGDGLDRARRAYTPAASSLGASPLKITLTILLPLSIPSLVSASLLVFLYCFTSFAVVLVLGGGPAASTLAVEIYRHARVFLDYKNAGVLAIVETLIAISVFTGYLFFTRKASGNKTDVNERAAENNRKIYGNEKIVTRFTAIIYGLVLFIFVLGPLLSIPVESFLDRPSRSAAQVFSPRWWLSLNETFLPALFRSLALAFLSATAACILAVLAAGAVKLLEMSGKRNSLFANFIRFLSAAPLVSSGIVLGLGWMVLYGRSFFRMPAALVLLHATAALPFAFNFISEGFRSLPANTMNAAAVSGASPFWGLLTCALPLSLPRIRSAWGFAAALSLGELNAVMMLGVEWETLPLYIYRAVGAYRYSTACAAGTMLILCCAAGFLLSEIGRKKYA